MMTLEYSIIDTTADGHPVVRWPDGGAMIIPVLVGQDVNAEIMRRHPDYTPPPIPAPLPTERQTRISQVGPITYTEI